MRNKLLIVQLSVGPTYKARLLHNLNTCPAYDLFDVFIMTDEVEYFASVAHRPNLIIKDLDELRKDFPWSVELEKIPPRASTEQDYARIMRDEQFKFPTLVDRFVWHWEHAEEYEGFIFMNCDILPIADAEGYKVMEEYYTSPVDQHPQFPTETSLLDKIIVVPGAGTYDEYHHQYLLDYAKMFNEKFKVVDKEIVHHFPVTDGNFRTFKFPDKKMIKPFFELVNNIAKEVLTTNDYFFIGNHSVWNLNSEHIYSIVFNLFDVQVFPPTGHWGVYPGTFAVCCFPEDRFWSWGGQMDSSFYTQEEFIQHNYDILKAFHEGRGQPFPYERKKLT